MKDEKLESLCQQVLDRAEELGVDSVSISWWFGDDQQERSFFHAPDVCTTELKSAIEIVCDGEKNGNFEHGK